MTNSVVKRIYLFFAILQAVSVLADVVNLTDADFDKVVDGSSNVLVEFYAPWCGHCKNLAPEWKIAGETFQPGDDIIIAAIDATANPKMGEKFGVKGFPTIKYFPKGKATAEEYSGGRTADTIISWVNNKVGLNRKLKTAPTAVTVLTEQNFESIVSSSNKHVLVEFYAPWCGHCKSLAPKYEQLANVFAGDKEVVIAKVDATEEQGLGTKYGISGYPTLKFFAPGSSEPESYDGARELDDMVTFINTNAGTLRTADGGLLPEAGRIADIDKLITFNANIDAKTVQSIKDIVGRLTGRATDHGKLYVATAEKVLAKGNGYVAKEIQRLTKMTKSSSVVPESKTNFQLRINILNAFFKETA